MNSGRWSSSFLIDSPSQYVIHCTLILPLLRISKTIFFKFDPSLRALFLASLHSLLHSFIDVHSTVYLIIQLLSLITIRYLASARQSPWFFMKLNVLFSNISGWWVNKNQVAALPWSITTSTSHCILKEYFTITSPISLTPSPTIFSHLPFCNHSCSSASQTDHIVPLLNAFASLLLSCLSENSSMNGWILHLHSDIN